MCMATLSVEVCRRCCESTGLDRSTCKLGWSECEKVRKAVNAQVAYMDRVKRYDEWMARSHMREVAEAEGDVAIWSWWDCRVPSDKMGDVKTVILKMLEAVDAAIDELARMDRRNPVDATRLIASEIAFAIRHLEQEVQRGPIADRR